MLLRKPEEKLHALVCLIARTRLLVSLNLTLLACKAGYW